VEQARTRAKAKDAIISEELELSTLLSSDFEGIEVETEGKEGSRVRGDEVRESKVEALASPNLQLQPKGAMLVLPGLSVGNSFNSCE
jgi:hypothetical protein